MRLLLICSVAVCALGTRGAYAAPPSASSDPIVDTQSLGQVVVTATRMPQLVLDTAASVTLVTADTIRHDLDTSIRRMTHYLPGVSVPTDASRFGSQGFRIRGIGGNRVMLLLDGVPAPDAFSIGNFSSAGRDFVDPSVFKRVEIIRGPASALYGSGAVAGVVSVTTKDPGDYLSRSAGSVYVGGGMGYSGVDDGAMVTVTAAAGDQGRQGMLIYTRRDGSAVSNQGQIKVKGARRTAPNPRQTRADNVLLKGRFAWPAATLRVTLGGHRGVADTRVFSELTTTDYSADMHFPYVIDNLDVVGHDIEQRARASARLTFGDASTDAGWANRGEAIVYIQHGETKQRTLQHQRKTIAYSTTDYRIRRDFEFVEKVRGGSLTLRQKAGEHWLVYGVDLRHSYLEEKRQGRQTNMTTGATTTKVGPDQYPVRDFPLSTTRDYGAFIQDRWALAQGRFLLVPGLRYDYYRLDARNDAIFEQDNPGIEPRDLTASSWSPRLGALYKLTDHTSLFAQYAYGFRAPPYNAVNTGFTNLQFGYTAIPNVKLNPETSQSLEFGIKHKGARGYFRVSAYYDHFDDFIETLVNQGVDPHTGLLTFQSQNIDGVTIYGLELQARLYLDGLVPGLWLETGAAWGVGHDHEHDQPLDSIAPPEAVIGVGYGAVDGRWNLRVMGRFVRAKTQLARIPGEPVAFAAPGYATLDVLATIELMRNMELVGGLFNITDKKYWDWSSVQGRPANGAVIDRYSAPGFHAGVSLHMYW